jgi:hypothetical protein
MGNLPDQNFSDMTGKELKKIGKSVIGKLSELSLKVI